MNGRTGPPMLAWVLIAILGIGELVVAGWIVYSVPRVVEKDRETQVPQFSGPQPERSAKNAAEATPRGEAPDQIPHQTRQTPAEDRAADDSASEELDPWRSGLREKVREYERSIAELEKARRVLEEKPFGKVVGVSPDGIRITGKVPYPASEMPEVGWLFTLTSHGKVKALAQVAEIDSVGLFPKLRVIRCAPGAAPLEKDDMLRLFMR